MQCMPPPDGCLFLLEFLVDKIQLMRDPCFVDSNYKTCVKFEFLGMDPLEVCDDHKGPENAVNHPGPYVLEFHAGKSVLFPLNDADSKKAAGHFPICATVFKTMPCGCLPTQIIMGSCRIDFHNEFAEARREFLSKPDCIGKRSIREAFPLTISDGEETGSILLFIRISCFGRMIETKLQSDGGCISTAPSASESKCSPGKKPWDEPCICRSETNNTFYNPPMTPPSAPTPTPAPVPCCCPPATGPYMYESSEENSCFCGGRVTPSRVSQYTNLEMRDTQQYCLHLPQRHRNRYEELGTNLNGNELKLKVPKEKAVIKKIGPTCTQIQRADVQAGGCGPGICKPPCDFNQIMLDVPGNDQQEASQFCYIADNNEEAFLPTSIPHNPAAVQKVLHPNKDVFVFKVAKRASTGDRKNKLELELVTPKGPQKRGLPRYESRWCQYEECPSKPRRGKSKRKAHCKM